ncbi:MAG: hypothetical protein JW937_01140 [Candidatus Omnitrophica bacterium]|nr:hypothetical protein [Candidatus Omnitrophota bacterium]
MKHLSARNRVPDTLLTLLSLARDTPMGLLFQRTVLSVMQLDPRLRGDDNQTAVVPDTLPS